MNGLKSFYWFSLFFACALAAAGQTDTLLKPETTKIVSKPLLKPIVALADTVALNDSIKQNQLLVDSLAKDSLANSLQNILQANKAANENYNKYFNHPYLPLQKPAIYMLIDYKKDASKDYLFYLLSGVVFLLAFIRLAFDKYFQKLFSHFFQTTMRQRQTRDQLLQDNLASLLTNLLFIINAGLYITLIIAYKNWIANSFWIMAAFSSAILLVTYVVKYLFLLFAGWVFNTKEAAGSYVFVVFLVNKVLGVLLVPFLWVVAFADQLYVDIAITLSAGLVVVLLSYRYWVSFLALQNKLKVNALHFLLYLCAVELLPLLLIYKVLVNYLDGKF